MGIDEEPIHHTKLFKTALGIMITMVLFSVFYYPFRDAGFTEIDAKSISLVLGVPIALFLVRIRWIMSKRKYLSVGIENLYKKFQR